MIFPSKFTSVETKVETPVTFKPPLALIILTKVETPETFN